MKWIRKIETNISTVENDSNKHVTRIYGVDQINKRQENQRRMNDVKKRRALA